MTKIVRKLVLSLVAVFASITMFAQMTTSSLNGRVLDNNGEPLVGAVVIATHTPSGSQYYATTNANGLYTIEGMRPGDGYSIEISFLGCRLKM